MPIEFNQPVPRDPITHAEITGFHVDLRQMTATLRIAEMTAAGEVVREMLLPPISLLDAQGQPRFTLHEYASIKHALYRIALEDGLVSGGVK